MTIKSLRDFLEKKRRERSAIKTIRKFKKRKIQQIKIDEDNNIHFVIGETVTTIKESHIAEETGESPVVFCASLERELDELFGANKEDVEDGKTIRVWGVR